MLCRSWTLAVCVALAACTTLPMAPPRGQTQELALRTDPAGARCWILQQGVVVASVTSTPGNAEVPRRNVPIEVICHHDGYLEARMTFAAASADEVELEAGFRRWRPSGTGAVAGFAADFVIQGAMVFFPVPILATEAAIAAAGAAGRRGSRDFGYRPLPGLLMVPDTFASPAEQDAFFADLQLRLEMAARAQRAYIDSHCHIWPCQATDVDCPNPICARQRVLVEEQLEIRLDEIPALRAQTKIVAPSEAGGDVGSH
jgi:hypothetical protein